MRRILLSIIALTLPSLALAVNCEKNPNHSQCQNGNSNGELTVYDSSGLAVGPFVAADAGAPIWGTFRYEFDYQGQREVVELFVSRNAIHGYNSFGGSMLYTNAGCQGSPWVESPYDAAANTIFQPPLISIHSADNAHGPGRSWLLVANGITDTDLPVVAERKAHAVDIGGVIYPAETCLPSYVGTFSCPLVALGGPLNS